MWVGSDCGGASYKEPMQQKDRHQHISIIIEPYHPEKRRERDVPRYMRCTFVEITRSIYDHGYDVPESVECGHPDFSQYVACSGQCAVFGMLYGERGGRE